MIYNGKPVILANGLDYYKLEDFLKILEEFSFKQEQEELNEIYCYEEGKSRSKVMIGLLLFNTAIIGLLIYLIYQ